jgi:hypothetical protein
MIDTIAEVPIPLTKAADDLPRRRRGRKTHVSTLFRWSTAGCRGVILETIQVGGTRCTSREALQRFFERLSQPIQAGAVGRCQCQPRPVEGYRTLAQCQLRPESVGRRLVELRASGEPPRPAGRAPWVRILNSRTFRAVATGVGALGAVLRLAMIAVDRLSRH